MAPSGINRYDDGAINIPYSPSLPSRSPASPQPVSHVTERMIHTANSLQWFGSRAEKDYRESIPEKRPLCWEIFTTWKLISFLSYVQMERELMTPFQRDSVWNEGSALHEAFIKSKGFRIMIGILRWLRWIATLESIEIPNEDVNMSKTRALLQGRDDSRERRVHEETMKTKIMHPDGALQYPHSYHNDDLEKEQRLLFAVWQHLRRGQMAEAMDLCMERKQQWRAAILQGILAHSPDLHESDDSGSDDGSPSENAGRIRPPVRKMEWTSTKIENDWNYQMDKLRERHTDWSEMPCVESGNPWRREAKKTHLYTAQTPPENMSRWEIGIHGYCAGDYAAIAELCNNYTLDRCWGRLHCLKEAFIERWIDESRQTSGEVFDHLEICPDPLLGPYVDADAGNLDSITFDEILRIFENAVDEEEKNSASEFHKLFRTIQCKIIHSLWEPSQSNVILDLMQNYILRISDGNAEVHPKISEFASYFATFESEKFTLAHLDDSPKSQEPEIAGSETEELNFPSVAALLAHHAKNLIRCKEDDLLLPNDLTAILAGSVDTIQKDEIYAYLILQYSDPKFTSREGITNCLRLLLTEFPDRAIFILDKFCTTVLDNAWSRDDKEKNMEELLHAITIIVELWTIICTLESMDVGVLIQSVCGFFGEEIEKSLSNLSRLLFEEKLVPYLCDLVLTMCQVSHEATLELSKALFIGEDRFETSLLWSNLTEVVEDGLENMWIFDLDIVNFLRYTDALEDWKAFQHQHEAGTYSMRMEGDETIRRIMTETSHLLENDFLIQMPTSSLSQERWKIIQERLATRIIRSTEDVHQTIKNGSLLEEIAIAVGHSSWVLHYIPPEIASELLETMASVRLSEDFRYGATGWSALYQR